MSSSNTYLECAGSIPTAFMQSGINRPMTTLEATMTNKLVVIAMVSGHGMKNTRALRNPAKPSITLIHNPVANSLLKNGFVVDEFMDPMASPRITFV